MSNNFRSTYSIKLLSLALPGFNGWARGVGKMDGGREGDVIDDGGGEGRVGGRKPPGSEDCSVIDVIACDIALLHLISKVTLEEEILLRLTDVLSCLPPEMMENLISEVCPIAKEWPGIWRPALRGNLPQPYFYRRMKIIPCKP